MFSRVNIPVLISKDYDKARMKVRIDGVPTDLKCVPSKQSTVSPVHQCAWFHLSQ